MTSQEKIEELEKELAKLTNEITRLKTTQGIEINHQEKLIATYRNPVDIEGLSLTCGGYSSQKLRNKHNKIITNLKNLLETDKQEFTRKEIGCPIAWFVNYGIEIEKGGNEYTWHYIDCINNIEKIVELFNQNQIYRDDTYNNNWYCDLLKPCRMEIITIMNDDKEIKVRKYFYSRETIEKLYKILKKHYAKVSGLLAEREELAKELETLDDCINISNQLYL